jgi:hypothetical protein
LLIKRTVNLPVLSYIACEGPKRNSHGETGSVGARRRRPPNQLEVERVRLSGDISERNVNENDLNRIVGDLVVAEATRFGDIIDVNLPG